jgi:hypothetical protein
VERPVTKRKTGALIGFAVAAVVAVMVGAHGGCNDDGYDTAMDIEAFPPETGIIFINFPPVPGNRGIITTLATNTSQILLLWAAAEDDRTPEDELEYCVYGSTENNIRTYLDAQANGFPVAGWGINATTAVAGRLLPGTTYYFSVFVRDGGGSITAYHVVSITTP